MAINPDLRRIAREVYDDFLAEGEEFSLSDVRDEVTRQVLSEPLAGQLAADAIEYAIRSVDNQRTAGQPLSTQPDLPGAFWDIEGAYKFGDERRIAKEAAQHFHGLESLEIARQNLANVQAAFDRRLEEEARLRPYWAVPGTTKGEAIRQWNAEHGAA